MNWLCMEEKCVGKRITGNAVMQALTAHNSILGNVIFYGKACKERSEPENRYDQITQCIRVQADTEADSGQK